jgi:hypothetical protein
MIIFSAGSRLVFVGVLVVIENVNGNRQCLPDRAMARP